MEQNATDRKRMLKSLSSFCSFIYLYFLMKGWKTNYSNHSFTTFGSFLHTYILSSRQTVSLYHNSSVWLDTWDAWSWHWNPPNFTLDLVSHRSANKQTTSVQEVLSSSFRLFTFIPYRTPECSVRSHYAGGSRKFLRQCAQPPYIYIYIYIYMYIYVSSW